MPPRARLVEELRRSLEAADLSVLASVAARLGAAEALGEAKRALRLPVYDPSREEEYLERLRERAEELGLGRPLAEELYAVLSREARCRQLYCPEQLRVAVYGYGGMAGTLAGLLSRAGCWVTVTGRSLEDACRLAGRLRARCAEPLEAAEWADVLVYAVPGDAVPGLLAEHLGALRESMLVADIASVKTPLVPRVREVLGERGEGAPEYASLHPLFGPSPCPSGEAVAVVPVRLEAWRDRLEALLGGLGLRAVYVTAEEHDRAMAVNQVLHHMAYEAFERAARRLAEGLGVPEELLAGLETRSLRETRRILERLSEIRGVVEEIRRLNPYSRLAAEALAEAVEELLSR